MHELSIVLSIVDIACTEMKKANAQVVKKIELDIGPLSGIEIESFDFAWQQAIKETPLDGCERIINHITGVAYCANCKEDFFVENYFDPCPKCHQHEVQIKTGKELRVKSLIVT